MTQSFAIERAFPYFERGQNREAILLNFRHGLRQITNPDTGSKFTEREIATATARLSRWWADADAVDIVLFAGQQRSLYLADQVRIDRAAISWLTGYHGRLWGQSLLPASGGSGPCNAPATVGTVWAGSTTIPDAAAVQGTDPAGKTYQVLFTVVTPGSGVAALQLKAVDTGEETNIPSATEIKWSQLKPLGAQEKGTTSALFTGGAPRETSAQFAKRLLDMIQHRAAAGNNAHFRAWARASSSSVEDAFVFACSLHAGTTLVALTQKRGNVLGPDGRIPSVGTLTSATTYLTPPGSAVVPAPPFVLVVPTVKQVSDLALGLALPKGQASGWEHLDPWPGLGTGAPFHTEISTYTDQTHFKITRGSGSKALPSGVTAPPLMVWNETQSRWEKLLVQSVNLDAGSVYSVVLSGAPSFTLAVGMRVSPSTERRTVIAETIEEYFDSLGPGELVDLSLDPRAHRAFRFPKPSEDRPQRAGSAVLTFLHDALGGALADSSLAAISSQTPSLPSDPTVGPSLMCGGKVGIYPL